MDQRNGGEGILFSLPGGVSVAKSEDDQVEHYTVQKGDTYEKSRNAITGMATST
jgi:hypothetical protein